MKDATKQKTTREAILDATDKLLTKSGYKKMTIDDLAQEVGIGKGSVYLHFSSKEEIALSHIDRIIEKLQTNLRVIAEKRSSLEDRLRAMLIERVIYRFDSVQHYSKSLDELLTYARPQLMERRWRYFDEESRIFAVLISEGQNTASFGAGDPVDVAMTLISATNSLLPYSFSTVELSDRKKILERVQKTADLLIKGLSC